MSNLSDSIQEIQEESDRINEDVQSKQSNFPRVKYGLKSTSIVLVELI